MAKKRYFSCNPVQEILDKDIQDHHYAASLQKRLVSSWPLSRTRLSTTLFPRDVEPFIGIAPECMPELAVWTDVFFDCGANEEFQNAIILLYCLFMTMPEKDIEEIRNWYIQDAKEKTMEIRNAVIERSMENRK